MSKKHTNFVKQAMILSVCGIVVRVIGVIYGIPLTNIIGDLGNGYYSSAYNMYSIILLICSYSVPMAVSKIMAEKTALGEYRTAHRVFGCSMVYVVAVGSIASILTFVCAPGLVDVPEAALAMRILAPTIFFSGMLSVMRGFFQAQNSMVPTAFSQVVEQIFNAVVSVAAAFSLVRAFQGGNESLIAQYGAAGGAMGTGAGVLAGVLLLACIYVAGRHDYKEIISKQKKSHVMSYPHVFRIIFSMVTPVIISTFIYNISTVVDMKLFYMISGRKLMDGDTAARLYGIFSRKFSPLATVPIALASAMVSAMVPEISASYARLELEAVKRKIGQAIQYSMLFIIPALCGLAVLAKPVMDLLYADSNNAAVGLLELGGIYILFSGISTVLNGVLQGIGKVNIPMGNAAAALVLHLIVLVPLLWETQLTIYAILIAASLYAVIISVLNYLAVRRILDYRQEWKKTFGAPLAASAVMSLCVWLASSAVHLLAVSLGVRQRLEGGITVAVCLVVAAAVYFPIVLKIGYTAQECRRIPFLSKFFK